MRGATAAILLPGRCIVAAWASPSGFGRFARGGPVGSRLVDVSKVMTVLGPVDAAELGVTLPHEHLLIDLFKVFQPHREFLVNDPEMVAEELRLYALAGGRTLVELTTPDIGRDAAGLVQIAERTGVHVVMG